MIFIYISLVGFPLYIMIMKIKHKEYDEPQMFVWGVIWIVGISILWEYLDWWTFSGGKGLYDPDWIRK